MLLPFEDGPVSLVQTGLPFVTREAARGRASTTHQGHAASLLELGSASGSAAAAAATLFERLAEHAELDSELTADERAAYKQRFVHAMATEQQAEAESFAARAQRHIEHQKPVMTAALADRINRRQSLFQVEMRSWMVHESVKSWMARLTYLPDEDIVKPEKASRLFQQQLPPDDELLATGAGAAVPDAFDVESKWPQCRHQFSNSEDLGQCGSCWAFGGVGIMDSRLCIATGGRFSGPEARLSRGFVTSCGFQGIDGCRGGWPHHAFDYVELHGVPTSGCVPYFASPEEHPQFKFGMPAPPCPAACTSEGYPRTLAQDLFMPRSIGQYRLVMHPDAQGLQHLRQAIFLEGPVPYHFFANREFMGYKSGIFNSTCGHDVNHAAQALGWGTDNGVDFFHSLNTFGNKWGMDGKFKIGLCNIWSYTVPGKINEDDFPLPLPEFSDNKTQKLEQKVQDLEQQLKQAQEAQQAAERTLEAQRPDQAATAAPAESPAAAA